MNTKLFSLAIVCFLLLGTSTFAQRGGSKRKQHSSDLLAKNRVILSISASGNIFDKKDIGTINTKLGYTAIDGLNFGLGYGYKNSASNNTQKLGGLYVRYYFVQGKISPFIEASYFKGKGQIKDILGTAIAKYDVTQYGGEVGAGYFGIAKRFAFETYVEIFQEAIGTSKSKTHGLLSVRGSVVF